MRLLMVTIALCLSAFARAEVPPNLYTGELVTYPGPWEFQIGRPHIILVSDEQLIAFENPDTPVNISLSATPHEVSLRQLCEQAQAAGQRTLIVAFDYFFAQYREGQRKPRELTPDKPEYITRIAEISKFAQQYGIGLELSLLSPLEIGVGYVADTGESGVWMHYRKGLRDPNSGAYSVQLWQQRQWANNKGVVQIEDAGVRVFAFREYRVGGTPYRVVDPAGIIEITDTAQVEVWEDATRSAGDFRAVRIRVHGAGRADIGPLDKVLVVQQYRTPEMDYFSENALPYLTGLCDQYADAGVVFNGLYADEMHIQQDWAYFSHHDNGEFALRYVSPGLAAKYSALHGGEYQDFAKYLVYFTYGQEDTAGDLTAKSGAMHVFGDSPEAIARTALFRARYYKLLQDGVVDLFTSAKRHLEARMGYQLQSRAHATWAESPTIDKWETGTERHQRYQYEYTPNFVWSDTVHQAASACYDYFKWGDFLTGNGNDHAEGGWLDRNYTGLALACSTGILNEVPYSYGAHWGMPHEISQRRQALVNVFGANASPQYGMVEGMEHRDVDVLTLYPLDLTAWEERFGSWTTQYAYANAVTQAKLLERGTVSNGAIEMAGRRFTTLMTQFEPFPSAALLAMMQELAESGGRVVWSGPPPVLLDDAAPALDAWQALCNVDYIPLRSDGLLAPGQQVVFENTLAHIAPMTILTDFLVDRAYPVTPREGTEPLARLKGRIIGTRKTYPSGGSVTFLGFRPRDDQSQSLGYEERHLFDILHALGAYPPVEQTLLSVQSVEQTSSSVQNPNEYVEQTSSSVQNLNNNTEALSRNTDYLCARFPNGALAIAPHLRTLEEDWPGGFARDRAEDEKIVATLTLPSETITLDNFQINGHAITYTGTGALAFRTNDTGALIAFAGANSDRITIDGHEILYAVAPLPLASWAPIPDDRRVDPNARYLCFFQGTGQIRLPLPNLNAQEITLIAQGPKPGSRGQEIPCELKDNTLHFTLQGPANNHWLYLLAR